MNAGETAIIALADASKSYGAVRAVRDTSIAVRPGEVRALVGENGAGKSTIVRLLAGVTRPDTGAVLVDGEPADFHGPADARDAGIAVIYQEPTLFPDLSVAENVMMGRQPLAAGRRIDRGALHDQVQGLLDRLGVRLDADQPVRGLSIADQQIVEIAKALSFDARVLIMDEPTAALSGAEVERLFAVVRTLQEHGAAVLFISHRLDEIFAICDTVTVLRDGEVTHDGPTSELNTDELVRRMVGRQLSQLFPKQAAEIGETVLRVERPCCTSRPTPAQARARATCSTSTAASPPPTRAERGLGRVGRRCDVGAFRRTARKLAVERARKAPPRIA